MRKDSLGISPCKKISFGAIVWKKYYFTNVRAMVKKKCRYWTTITQTVQGYPRIWPGVNGLAKPRFMQLKRPFWGVLIYQNNFPGQALNVCLKLWFYGLIWDILGPSKCILWPVRFFDTSWDGMSSSETFSYGNSLACAKLWSIIHQQWNIMIKN